MIDLWLLIREWWYGRMQNDPGVIPDDAGVDQDPPATKPGWRW